MSVYVLVNKESSSSLTRGFVTDTNIERVCKICLEEKEESLPLTALIEFPDFCSLIPAVSLGEILSRVTSVSISMDDSPPSIICYDCLAELKSSYLFLMKYEEAVRIVNAYLSMHVKTEETDLTAEEENSGQDNTCDQANGASDAAEDEETAEKVPYQTRSAGKRPIKRRARRKKEEVDAECTQDTKMAPVMMHPCPVCTLEFTALDLRDHAHTHKALKKYLNIPEDQQVSPTSKFYTRRHLVNPGTSLFAQEERLHKCPYCNEDFLVDEFRLHLDVHRKQHEFKCDKCDRVFKRLNHLNTHRVKHLKEFPYKCDQCTKGFVIKTNYDCHVLTHTIGELPHECRFCLRRFSNPEHLNRHQIIHTENVTYSVKYRVCRCHHCLKTFKDRDELKRHKCVPIEQSAAARFPCKTCKKVFKHASGLYNHNRFIHALKGAKTLCSVCGKHVSNIYNHMLRHSGEKPYQCTQCDKRFIAKPQLKQHLLVHSGLKPYVCSVCAKAFNSLYNLQVHERIHKGDRCHICPVCSKGFLEKSYLKKHMNVHAKIA